MNNAAFLERAFRDAGPKLINGFSRPFYHNLMGLLHGRRFARAPLGGMLRHTEAGMLYQWARQLPRRSLIVEIGCYAGLSTRYLASGCRRNESRVVAIDPFASDPERQARLSDGQVSLHGKPGREQVRQGLEKDGLDGWVELIEGYAQEVARDWSRPVNFLWIDGNHDRALQDYRDWSPFLAPGARLAIHDAHPRYGLPNVAEAAREIFSGEEWQQLEHVKSIISGIRK
jgi:predicted O-methyltransferase YrrM